MLSGTQVLAQIAASAWEPAPQGSRSGSDDELAAFAWAASDGGRRTLSARRLHSYAARHPDAGRDLLGRPGAVASAVGLLCEGIDDEALRHDALALATPNLVVGRVRDGALTHQATLADMIAGVVAPPTLMLVATIASLPIATAPDAVRAARRMLADRHPGELSALLVPDHVRSWVARRIDDVEVAERWWFHPGVFDSPHDIARAFMRCRDRHLTGDVDRLAARLAGHDLADRWVRELADGGGPIAAVADPRTSTTDAAVHSLHIDRSAVDLLSVRSFDLEWVRAATNSPAAGAALLGWNPWPHEAAAVTAAVAAVDTSVADAQLRVTTLVGRLVHEWGDTDEVVAALPVRSLTSTATPFPIGANVVRHAAAILAAATAADRSLIEVIAAAVDADPAITVAAAAGLARRLSPTAV